MTATKFRKAAGLAIAGAATAAAAVTLLVAPAANAADEQWGGIATGPEGRYAIWFDKPSAGAAGYFGNWKSCGADCKRQVIFDKCGALAYNNSGESLAAKGDTLEAAEAAALSLPDSWIQTSGCNSNVAQG